MVRAIIFAAVALLAVAGPGRGQEDIEEEFARSSDQHMREELGVNPITAPQIQQVLKELEIFRPIPMALLESANREAVFNNRIQTAMNFGSLVADGFMLTLAERPKDLQDIGRALIRQSRALGVGERLTKRSKSLLEYADKGEWIGMRQELIRTQEDVEQSMLELRDEEMAHMISFGGWLRGFQLAATSTATDYTPAKAQTLGQVGIMEYFLDRLETLHPRLKKTQIVSTLIARVKDIRMVALEAQGEVPTPAQVARMKTFADEAEAVAMARVDDEGNFEVPRP